MGEKADAAAYHRRCVEVGMAEGRPIAEYAKSALYVATYHMAWGGGDYKLARDYCEKLAASNVEESTTAVRYLRDLRAMGLF